MKKIVALVLSIIFCLTTGIVFAANPDAKPAEDSAKKEEAAPEQKKQTSKKKAEQKEEKKAAKPTPTPSGGYGTTGGYK